MLLISPVSVNQTSKILCYYFNSTAQIQIVKLLENERYSLEKVVFPQQRVLFESTLKGQVEVYCQQDKQAILQKVFYTTLELKKHNRKLVAA